MTLRHVTAFRTGWVGEEVNHECNNARDMNGSESEKDFRQDNSISLRHSSTGMYYLECFRQVIVKSPDQIVGIKITNQISRNECENQMLYLL